MSQRAQSRCQAPCRKAGTSVTKGARAAVVLMAYGSPERIADVPAYYADIRGGRPIRPELLDDLVERYRRLDIETGSPLNAVTEETRVGLVLAPHYSRLSIAGYRAQLEAALAGRAEFVFVESWHDDEGLVDFLAARVRSPRA